MSNAIFQGACQVTTYKIVTACANYKELYNRLVAIYNEDMEKLKNDVYTVRSFFRKNKTRSKYDDYNQLCFQSWFSKEDVYVTYWKDGKGIRWSALEKAVFCDSYEEVYYQLKKLSSVNSDMVIITPDQANFIDKWAEK